MTASGAVAGLKVVLDVLVFRLRRLEMANLAAAVSIMLVLYVPWADALLRTAFATLLNLLVYLNNDYLDLDVDLKATGRDRERTSYLGEHRAAARIAQWALLCALVGLAALGDASLWCSLILGGGICWAYSARLKGVPGADMVAMFIWGGAMPLCAFPLDQSVGWLMAGQLAIFSAVFESIQVTRDEAEDRAAGVQTTAVALGVEATAKLTRLLLVLSGVYAALVMHPAAGALAAAAALLPRGDEPARYWTRIKLLLGLCWLGSCLYIALSGQSGGLLLQVGVQGELPPWR